MKWEFTLIAWSFTSWWYACHTQKHYTEGVAKQHKKLPSEIQAFWTFQEGLTIEDGLILKVTRIVVPSQKQAEILKLIHEGHLGLTKCKLRAKDTVYWPGLNEQLEKLVLNHQLCIKYLQSKCKLTPNMSLDQEIPAFLWAKLDTDIFHFEGDSYLLLVDYTSRYPIISMLTSMTAQHVIGHLKLSFLSMGCWMPLYQTMGHVTPLKLSPRPCKNTGWIISPVHPITPSQMDLQRSLCKQLKACSTRPEKKEQTHIRPWWFIETHHLQATCNLQCRSYKIELPGYSYQCPTVLGDSLVWRLRSSE